jgi:hypothetical protein
MSLTRDERAALADVGQRGMWNPKGVAVKEHLAACEKLLADLIVAPFVVDLVGPGDVVEIDRHLWRDLHERATELLSDAESAPARREPTPCQRCDGCGRLADTDAREPWSAWENLPVKSAFAVIVGAVRPVPCDVCGGTGRAP